MTKGCNPQKEAPAIQPSDFPTFHPPSALPLSIEEGGGVRGENAKGS
jgi:hypothetical protein